MTDTANILLSGVVGSTAYGLNREGSDIDTLGVYAAATLDVAGLHWHSSRETVHTTKPDTTLHEIGKWCRLALKGNPTITELCWLPHDLLDTVHPEYGTRLIELRTAFLSDHAITSAYGGYARQQAHRLDARGDSTFSADTRKRTTKHARHLLRLLRQGRHLRETGTLTVRIDDPGDYFAFDDMSPQQMINVYEREDALFSAVRSVLPTHPDTDKIRGYLDDVRRHHLERP